MGREPKQGVYISRSGNLKTLEMKTKDEGRQYWELDEGKFKPHPIFRASFHVVMEADIGWPFMDYQLKNCEYLGEL